MIGCRAESKAVLFWTGCFPLNVLILVHASACRALAIVFGSDVLVAELADL